MHNRGVTVTSLIISFGGACIGMLIAWNAGLSMSVFEDHATLSGLVASVEFIAKSQERTEELVSKIAQKQGVLVQSQSIRITAQ